jgi:regulator of sigma E protease
MDVFSIFGSGLSAIFWFTVPFILVLSIVVFFHELGHFWAARFFGVKIEAFSIGFGRELFAWVDKHGTRWRLALLPLGGYVKFWGDQDATTSRVDEGVLSGASSSDRAGFFHHKPLYQKAIIAAAGPFANFVLAIVIFAGLNMAVGERILPARLGAVDEGSPAATAGLRPGDLIVAVNGDDIRSYVAFMKAESLSAGVPMTLKIDRNDEVFTVNVTPASVEMDDGQGGKVFMPRIGVDPYTPAYVTGLVDGSPAAKAGVQLGDLIVAANGKPVSNFGAVRDIVTKSGGKPISLTLRRDAAELTVTMTPEANQSGGRAQFLVGIRSDPDSANSPFKLERVYHDPVSATGKAFGDVGFIVSKVGEFMGQLVTGTGDYRQLSGPIGIAKVSSDVAQVSLASLIQLIAVLSVSVGLLNLLPIPILDGGHLLYYAIEAVRGRPLGERAQEFGFRIGLLFVLGLMIVATLNDIVKVPGW